MSLLGGNVNDGAVKDPAPSNLKSAKSKASRQKKIKEQFDAAQSLRKELESQGIFDKLSAKSKGLVLQLCKDPAVKAVSTQSTTFSKLFGPTPKVGDKVTLIEAFNRTDKGKASINIELKRWAQKGIIVDFVEDSSNTKNSTYVIKALPSS